MIAEEVIEELKQLAEPEFRKGLARFGLPFENALGVRTPFVRKLAKKLGTNHKLALALWTTGIDEARLIAAIIADIDKATIDLIDNWVNDFDNWAVVDQTCNNLLRKTKFAEELIYRYCNRSEEFVKRTAYALIACIAWNNKNINNERFLKYLKLLEDAATDERNYVKKAVNWALRQIGKRNRMLNAEAILIGENIARLDSKSAKWIASDALRELRSGSVQKRLTVRM